MEENVVLEKHWSGRQEQPKTYKNKRNPQLVQMNGLSELRRVLKRDGILYLAIENRYGLQYFFGYPDDHVNIPFASILPRFLSNALTKLICNHSYRTYLYSPKKLASILKSVGFDTVKVYQHFHTTI